MKKVLFIFVILFVLGACKPNYIDSRPMHGIIKNVDNCKIDINGGIYDYDANWIEITSGDTIVYVIRNYRRSSNNNKLLLVKSVNGSVIK